MESVVMMIKNGHGDNVLAQDNIENGKSNTKNSIESKNQRNTEEFIEKKDKNEGFKRSGLILIVWAGSVVLALFLALCYVELATMFPESSGSNYSFVYEGFGDLPAFISGFTFVVILSPMSFVMVMLTCSNYIVLAAMLVEEYIKIIAAIIIGVVFILNCNSVNLGTIIQEIFTTIKILTLLMIAITGVVRLGQESKNFFMYEMSIASNTNTMDDFKSVSKLYYLPPSNTLCEAVPKNSQ
nr:Y+L amino acid transporter 1-like [Hydra vulgaris]